MAQHMCQSRSGKFPCGTAYVPTQCDGVGGWHTFDWPCHHQLPVIKQVTAHVCGAVYMPCTSSEAAVRLTLSSLGYTHPM
jgi:hypothetical protein